VGAAARGNEANAKTTVSVEKRILLVNFVTGEYYPTSRPEGATYFPARSSSRSFNVTGDIAPP
jgi:hypothetical protein